MSEEVTPRESIEMNTRKTLRLFCFLRALFGAPLAMAGSRKGQQLSIPSKSLLEFRLE